MSFLMYKQIKKKVRGKFVFSPITFNAYMQETIHKINFNANLGIKINEQNISMLRFTDDITLINENEKDQEI